MISTRSLTTSTVLHRRISNDHAGNQTSLVHTGATSFARAQTFAADSNRLVSTELGHTPVTVPHSATEIGRDGTVVSHEEFHPWGSTSLHLSNRGTRFRRRYRWSGKERDTETGLMYFGARYYSPSLGRWASADPAGNVDGNAYWVVRGNPVGLREVDRRQAFSLDWADLYVAAGGDASNLVSQEPFESPNMSVGRTLHRAQVVESEHFDLDTSRVDSRGNPVQHGDSVSPSNSSGQSNDPSGHSTFGVRTLGVVRVAGGVAEMATGAAIQLTGVGIPLGGALILHGADQVQAGAKQALSGEDRKSYFEMGVSYGLESAGMDEADADLMASFVAAGAGVALTLGATIPRQVLIGESMSRVDHVKTRTVGLTTSTTCPIFKRSA